MVRYLPTVVPGRQGVAVRELESRLCYLLNSLGQSSELARRSRSEALRAASLFREGSTQRALHQSRRVLEQLSNGELRRWQPILSMVIEDIDTGLTEASSQPAE